MKKISLSLFFILTVFFIHAQSEMLHQICLKQNKANDFFDLLSKTTGQSEGNAILFIVPPSNCPRCDALIHTFNLSLAQNVIDVNRYAIFITDKIAAAKEYLTENKVWDIDNKNSYFFMSQEKFHEYFNSSTAEIIQVPFIAGVNFSKKTITYSASILGSSLDEKMVVDIKDSFTKSIELICDKNNKYDSDYEVESKIISGIEPPLFKSAKSPQLYHRHLIDTADDRFTLSELYNINIHDSIIFGNDHMTNSVVEFRLSDNKALKFKKIGPSDFERTYFFANNIPQQLKEYLLNLSITRVMYFSPFLHNGYLYIPASLPYLSFIDSTLTYFNMACLVIKTFPEGKFISIEVIGRRDSLTELSGRSDVGVSHLRCRISNHNTYILPAERNAYYSKGGYIPDSIGCDIDPKCDEFYNFTPLFMEMSLDGKPLRFIGNLDPLFRRIKCGYSRCEQIYKTYKDGYLITDGYSGRIHIYDNYDNKIQEITLFTPDIPYKNIPDFNSSSKKYSKWLAQVLPYRISDMYSDGKDIYCTILSSHRVYLCQYDLNKDKFVRISCIKQPEGNYSEAILYEVLPDKFYCLTYNKKSMNFEIFSF